MQSDGGFPHFSLQLLKGYIQFELHLVGHTQLLTQPSQHQHPILIFLIPASTDENQLQPLPPPVQHFLEGSDLQPVVLLWPELPDGNDGAALPVPVIFQRNVQEGADVAGRVDHAGAVGRVPQ